jgi:hypothetical protein
MHDPNQWFRFITAFLAVWRLTHLLAAEDGPWNIIAWLRRHAGSTVIGKLMDCFYCLSIWIGIPFAFYVERAALDRLVAWLALSGAASLLHQFTSKPVDFDPFAETKEASTNKEF